MLLAAKQVIKPSHFSNIKNTPLKKYPIKYQKEVKQLYANLKKIFKSKRRGKIIIIAQMMI